TVVLRGGRNGPDDIYCAGRAPWRSHDAIESRGVKPEGENMKDFAGRLSVVTGGGTGIGRALVAHLAAAGADVAMCDVNAANMDESRSEALAGAPENVRVETFVADVSDADAMGAFGAYVRDTFQTESVNLVINN